MFCYLSFLTDCTVVTSVKHAVSPQSLVDRLVIHYCFMYCFCVFLFLNIIFICAETGTREVQEFNKKVISFYCPPPFTDRQEHKAERLFNRTSGY